MHTPAILDHHDPKSGGRQLSCHHTRGAPPCYSAAVREDHATLVSGSDARGPLLWYSAAVHGAAGVRAPWAESHFSRPSAEYQHRTRIAVEVPADGDMIRGDADMYTSTVGVGSVYLICAVCIAVSLRTAVPGWHRRCGPRASGST